MNKLSPAMHRTLAKLTTTYQSPKKLGESINTLEALCRRGLAESDYKIGYSVTTHLSKVWVQGKIKYKIKYNKEKTK